METNELKNIWKTLAKEKLIEKELAEENIERIISLKSSNTIARLNKKLKFNFATNGITAVFIIAIIIFAAIFKHLHNHSMPLETYAFLFLALAFFVFKSFNFYSKIKLLKLSSTTTTIKDSLNIARSTIEKAGKTDIIIGNTIGIAIIIFGNVLLNEHTDFANFNVNSFQGYVLIFSLIAVILAPFTDKKIFRMRFSGIIKDITNSLKELEEK
jgi:hypothetical protein